jgi:hypothetical protein
MSIDSAIPVSAAILEWPPPLEDNAIIETLTNGVVSRAQTATSDIVTHLRRDLSVRARATFCIALLLRERQDTPLRALLGTAQDLLEPETDETCENLIGVLCSGWSQGIGELLAAARAL